MSPAAAMIAVLGEDLLREVFIRLPTPEDLVRAAAACKPFLRIVRSPPFLRCFHRRHPSSCPRVLGCLIISKIPDCAAPQIIPYRPSSSNFGLAKAGAFALSFLPGGGWPGDSTWQLLDCRNGRILVKNLVSQELGITDPLSLCDIVLPAPPTQGAVGWGLLTDDADSSVFRVVCISRDATSRDLRALILSSSDLSWTEVTSSFSCQPDIVGTKAMQAKQSLYWKLKGRERMLAFSTATMEFSLVDLPPSLRKLSFDVIERGEEGSHVLHLLTINDFCVEIWAGTPDGNGGMAWRQVEKMVRFHRWVKERLPSVRGIPGGLDVVGVVAEVVFVRHYRNNLFSIDLQTMKLRVLSKAVALSADVYPYTITWPPYFLNPDGKGM